MTSSCIMQLGFRWWCCGVDDDNDDVASQPRKNNDGILQFGFVHALITDPKHEKKNVGKKK